MPATAKKFVAASIIYLLLGLTAQAAAAFDVWLGFNPLAYTTVTAVTQLLLLGWLTQIALALVYGRWLTPFTDDGAGRWVFILFNLGLPLVIIGQPGVSIFTGPWIGAAAALGALLQLAAGVVLSRQIWSLLKKGSK